LARILIVDDEPGVREALRRLVKAEGHVATVAGDTTEARAELSSGSFELILCDVNLPGESGWSSFTTSSRVATTSPS
jgi:DNA-binding response OmpR family regulator